MKKTITVEDFIRNVLQSEIGEIIKEGHPYLAFSLIAEGIEFLGKCLNSSSDWQESNHSRTDFENAIKTLSALEAYRKYVSPSSINLFSGLRCGLAHALSPKSCIGLANGSNAMFEKDGKLTLFIDSLYADFCNACNELLGKSWPTKNKTDIFLITEKFDITATEASKNL